MRLSATGYCEEEQSVLCDKVTQQEWQMIFSKVFVSMCYVKNDTQCHFQAWADKWIV